MRHNRACLARTSFALAFVAILFWAGAVSGQTTSFSYQGRLTDGGTAANGNYDLQFALFDSVSGGAQIGATQTIPNVPVSAGIFTVPLDFGATAFPGAPRFLEISARLAGGPSFITLSPRQQITSTPYAIRSLNASTADAVTAGGTLSGNIVNATTQYNIGGNRVLSSPGNGNFFAGFSAGQANTGSLNNFFGVNAGQANTTGSENNFFGEAAGYFNTGGFRNSFFGDTSGADTNGSNPSGSENSFFGGNSGRGNTTGSFNTAVGAGTRFGSGNLDYATAIGANARVNQSNSLVLGSVLDAFTGAPSVNVGIGTTTPQSRLHVVGSSWLQGDNTPLPASAGAGIVIGYGAGGSGGYITAHNYGTGAAKDLWLNTSGGNVGIGTITPQATLDVNGAAVFRPGGVVREVSVGSPNGETGIGIRGTSNRADVRFDGLTLKLVAGLNTGPPLSTNGVAIDTAGNVGIGTTSPGAKLHIVGGLLKLDQIDSGFGAGTVQLCRNTANVIAVCASSSLRYKERIASFSRGLDLIRRLRPISFTWKADGSRDLGLGAEDVARVEPLLVTHNDKGEIEGVRYDRLNVVLINAIKEQQQQIELLKREIRQLRTASDSRARKRLSRGSNTQQRSRG